MKKIFSVLLMTMLLSLPLFAFADEDSWVSTPNISVTTATGSATFTLKSDSKDAKIYYTTNGNDPTTSSSRYTRSVKVTKTCEVRAVAYEDGEYSDVGYYLVTVTKARTAKPVIKGSNVDGGKKITITCSSATIYYTLDGTTPTTDSKRYTSSGIIVGESCVVKAIGVRSGYAASPVSTAIVNISQLNTPKMTKTTSSGKTVLKLSGPVSGCTYYYTTNGSTPKASTSSSCKKYTSSGIKITSACTVKAIACKPGYAPSDVITAEIEGPECATPSVRKTAIAGGYKVTLTGGTSGATMYYTTDGSIPTTSDERFTSSGVNVTEEGTTKFYVLITKSGYSSVVVSFKISVTQLPKPSAVDASTSSYTKIRLKGTSGSKIYYTTNGDDPTTSDKYVSAGNTITIKSSCTLKAMAVKAGYANSEIYAATIKTKGNEVKAPTASGYKYSDYTKVTLKCATSGATIYYSTDGRDPFEYGDTCSSGTVLKFYSSAVLKIGARKSGYEDSDVVTYNVTVEDDDIIFLELDEKATAADKASAAATYNVGDEIPDEGKPDTAKETYFPDVKDESDVDDFEVVLDFKDASSEI